MVQATTSYSILSQDSQVNENENDFSSSLSSDGSEDSLDLVLKNIRNQRPKRKIKRKHRIINMARIDGFDAAAESYEELIGSAKRKRQFLIIGILCLLAVVVVLAVVFSVMLLKSDEKTLDDINLNDILQGKLQPKRFNGTWIDGKSLYFFDANGDFVIFDAESRNREIRVAANSSIYENFASSSSFEFSHDRKYILLATNIIKLYRHSFFATWKIFDIEKNIIMDIELSDEDVEHVYRLVKFGTVGSAMIIVDRFNIFYKESAIATAVNVTKDGELNSTKVILNGVPDWVYEEEVFSSNSATWFSKDGKKIAYIQFDDSKVPSISLSVYGLPGQYKYPEMYPVQYPKAGANNPVVKLFYADVSNFGSIEVKEIKKPLDIIDDDYLITSVAWANENDLISVWMNRVQNRGLIYKCKDTDCKNVFSLTTDEGWIEFFTAPFFNANGNEMIFIGSTDGYRHIKVLNLETSNISNRTSGKYIVTEILKYNNNNNVIIYTANTEADIKDQHVYAIRNENRAEPVCLTCKLFDKHSYYSAEVSEDGSHLIINSGGTDIPRSDLYTLKVDGNSITLANHLEMVSNDEIRQILSDKKMPRKIYDSIPLDDETEASVMMIVPYDLDEEKKYPMLVEVYGGPDSSSVTHRFSIEWGTYLASSLGIVYAKIDGRGSGLKSDKHLHALYKHLGTVEVEDQVRTAKKLHEKYSYLDSSRIGIWGWSYGGYVSGMSLMRNDCVYKCATSVAPVTDWTLYDSIYTERYMLTPSLNAEPYNVSRMMNYVENIKKNKKLYMLVHGTLDDNVHFQQGMLLARVLERADIQFKEITYPDEDHSLSGVRPHLYHSLENFFKGCFNLND